MFIKALKCNDVLYIKALLLSTVQSCLLKEFIVAAQQLKLDTVLSIFCECFENQGTQRDYNDDVTRLECLQSFVVLFSFIIIDLNNIKNYNI